MALATSQGNQPLLSRIPGQLPKTQGDWQALVNALQQWQQALQAPTWQAPTLENGWVAYGSPYEPPGYYMDVTGRVHLRGLVKSGTLTSSIFTLPSGYTPPYTLIVAAISVEALCEVRINSGGDVYVAGGGSTTWVSLSGISFSIFP